MGKSRETILWIQSIYYFLLGLWPLVHLESFIEITDDKTDLWLLKTVSILLICVAITFIIELVLKENSSSVVFLSISTSLSLLFIAIYYSFTDRIRDIYLIDAALQLLLLQSWFIYFGRSKNSSVEA